MNTLNQDKIFQVTEQNYSQVINAFGAVLETSTLTPGVVADTKELPYEKEQIKLALQLAMANTKDTQMLNSLEVSYLSLVDWQDNVGDEHQGFDMMKLLENTEDIKNMTNDEITNIAQKITEEASKSDKWKPIVDKELEQLYSDIKKLRTSI